MKKYFKIRRANPGFIEFNLIENDRTVGGYLIPDRGDNKKSMAAYLKKEGYVEYEKKGVKGLNND